MGEIRIDQRGAVVTITLSNPAKRNAIDLGMYRQLPDTVEDAVHHQGVRVVVVRGDGDEAFSAGSDISQFREERFGDQAAEYNRIEHRAHVALRSIPVPTIAAVHGPCRGGGLAIALCADLRWAADDATFALPPASLGLGYDPEATAALVRAVGDTVARRLLLTAQTIDAAEARASNLVSAVVPAAELDARVSELAAQIASLSPLSLAATKATLAALAGDRPIGEASALVRQCFSGADYQEGLDAWAGKRPAVFRG